MEFNSEPIYKIFRNEWLDYCSNHYRTFGSSANYAYDWKEFIARKDLGIICTEVNKTVLYKIVDEKKWLIARIKYGI